MRLSSRSAIIVLTAAIAAVATSAAAESKRVREACGKDIQKLCPGEKRDSPSLRYCMEAKVNYLSKRCVRALEDAGEMPRGYVKGR